VWEFQLIVLGVLQLQLVKTLVASAITQAVAAAVAIVQEALED
jgi:hypothetical protein